MYCCTVVNKSDCESWRARGSRACAVCPLSEYDSYDADWQKVIESEESTPIERDD